MLSSKQSTLYWRTWASVCVFMGWKNSDSTRRYALHSEAECPASMKDFTNRDFDRFLDYSSTLMDKVPAPRDPERERLCYAIARDAKKGGLSEAYLGRLSTDRFDSSHWRELPIEKLELFRNTIHNRASAHHAKEAKETALATTCGADQPF